MNNSRFSHLSSPNVAIPSVQIADKDEANKRLTEAIGDSHDVLARARTVFPFTLFPSTLTVDRTKLTIAHREFLKAAEVISIRIEDILNIRATIGPLFGSIQIDSRFYDSSKPYTLNYFWRVDVLKIKRIVQGYVIAKKEGVDCSPLATNELASKLDELGKVAHEDTV